MPHTLTRSRLAFGLGLPALSLLLACGGASSSSGPASAPATNPAAPKATLQSADPFWTTDAPIRPAVAPLFRQFQAPGAIIALSPREAAEAAAAPAPSASEPTQTLLTGPALAPQLRIVVGLRSLSFHQDNTTTLQPLDLSATPIQALVPNASGGFDTLTGAGHSDGTFSIPNVPEGYYWLRFGSTYVWTSSSYVDWSNDLFGRADGVYPGNSPTTLSLSLTGLNPWQAQDDLVWDVPVQGTALALPLGSADIANAPAPGATALAGFSVNFAGNDIQFPLLDGTKGDQAYLNQLTTRPAGAETYRALAKSFVAPATTMTDGGTTNLSGGFLDVPQASSLRLNWQRSAFAALAPGVNPAAVPSGSFFFTYAYPLPSSYGLPANAFELLDYTGPGTGDVDLGDLPYGNPFPASWSVAAETYEAFNVSYLAPGATSPLVLTRYSYQATTTLPTAAAPVTPLLGPIQAPKINGKDLFANQLSVGTNPTLSWNPPSVGAPSGYVISCYRLFASGTGSSIQTVGRFRTRTTSIKLPSGILAAGNTYVFTIAAIRANGVDLGTTPFKTALPYAFTTSMSAIVAP
ncbi:MAG TPA: fibronectin type III domain-containing protein [Holophagaceae bacterium]|nr:fibronectin type III domain-containing protein [Holophagaceae bacterium]